MLPQLFPKSLQQAAFYLLMLGDVLRRYPTAEVVFGGCVLGAMADTEARCWALQSKDVQPCCPHAAPCLSSCSEGIVESLRSVLR